MISSILHNARLGRVHVHGHRAKVVDMLRRKILKKFGTQITNARRRHKISQVELGHQLWPSEKLTDSAAQTRVYRVESGSYELDVDTTRRILETLQIDTIDPVTLLEIDKVDDKRGFFIHRDLFELFPDLHHYLILINQNLDREDYEQVKIIIGAITKYLAKAKPSFPNKATKETAKTSKLKS